MHVGVVMAGESDETDFARLFGGFKCLHRPARPQNARNVALLLNIVHLPQVEVVGLQRGQREMELVFGLFPRALEALGSEENVLAEGRQDVAVSLLRVAFPVGVRAIEIVQAEVVRAPHLGPGALLGAQ